MRLLSYDSIKDNEESGTIKFSSELDDDQFQGASVEMAGETEVWMTNYKASYPFTPNKSYATRIDLDENGDFVAIPGMIYHIKALSVQSPYPMITTGRSSWARRWGKAVVAGDRRGYIPASPDAPQQLYVEFESMIHNLRINPTLNLAHLMFVENNNPAVDSLVESEYGKGVGIFKDGKLLPKEDVKRGDSYQLTLAGEDVKIATPSPRIIEMYDDMRELEEEFYTDVKFKEEGFTMRPGDRVLAHTNESVRIDDMHVGTMDDFSPEAGLDPHCSAGMGDPRFGWKCNLPGYERTGQYTLEMVFNGTTNMIIKPNMDIARYRFHQLDRRTSKPYGEMGKKGGSKYTDNTGTKHSMLQKDAKSQARRVA